MKNYDNLTKFYGTMKVTPKYAKCDPLFITGRWVKKTPKETGKPFSVWCDDGLYKNGINTEVCEIVEVNRGA